MKDKKVVQAQIREQHLAEKRLEKIRRRGEPRLERLEPAREEKPVILIVCEGENTEPSYFNQFRLASAKVKALGSGNNTMSLVTQAISLSQQGNYDQVWCVFDKDQFPAHSFDNAIRKAEANGFRVAYSNQSFEYWLILHFEDHQGGAMHRSQYDGTINKYIRPLGGVYDGQGNKIISTKFFDILMGVDTSTKKARVALAIERAKRNCTNWCDCSPSSSESSTKVFELVEEMMKYL